MEGGRGREGGREGGHHHTVSMWQHASRELYAKRTHPLCLVFLPSHFRWYRSVLPVFINEPHRLH